jgi:hypothetical protein
MEPHPSVNEQQALRGIREAIGAMFGKRRGVDLEPTLASLGETCNKKFFRGEVYVPWTDAEESQLIQD